MTCIFLINTVYSGTMMKKCVVCGAALSHSRHQLCRDHYRQQVAPKVVLRPHRCYECGKQLKKGQYKYCSDPCRSAVLDRKLAVCARDGCNNRVKKPGNRFCSRECYKANAKEKKCLGCGTELAGYGSKLCPSCTEAKARLRRKIMPVLDEKGRYTWS